MDSYRKICKIFSIKIWQRVNPNTLPNQKFSFIQFTFIAFLFTSFTIPFNSQSRLLADTSQKNIKNTNAIISPLAKSALIISIKEVGDRIFAIGERGHILYSEDKGETWLQAQVPIRTLITSIFFIDKNMGWATSHESRILNTSDGGSTWQLQHQDLDLDPIPIKAIRDTNLVPDNDDWQNTNWDQDYVAIIPPGAPLFDIWFSNNKKGLAIGAYGLVLSTLNGGNSWSKDTQLIPNPDGWHYNALRAYDDQTLLIVGEAGTFYRSMDKGKSWESIDFPFEGSLFGVLCDPKNNTILAYGIAGAIFKSTSLGDSWKKINSDSNANIMGATLISPGNYLLVGSGGSILNSKDSGNSFTTMHISDRSLLVSAKKLNAQSMLISGAKGIQTLPLP